MADIDLDELDLFLGAIQLQPPIPPDFQTTFHGIEDVTHLEGGRVRVIALLATGAEAPRQSSMLLREEDGRYRIIFGRETSSEARGTPVP